MRIFVGVFSWRPLRYRVYRLGDVRVAPQPFDPAKFEDRANSLITNQLPTDDPDGPALRISLREYLSELEVPPAQLWRQLEREIGRVLSALALQRPDLELGLLERYRPLLGFDYLFVRDSGTLKPCLLEMNIMPARFLADSPGYKAIDRDLMRTHIAFFRDLFQRLPGQALGGEASPR